MGYTTEQWIISDNRHTRGVQKVRSLTQLATRYAHHILSLFNFSGIGIGIAAADSIGYWRYRSNPSQEIILDDLPY